MKPPRLINLAAAVSLLLALAIVFLWVRSYARHEQIARKWQTSTEQHTLSVQSLYSSLDFMITGFRDVGPPIAPRYEYTDLTRDDRNLDPRRWFPFPPARFQRFSAPLNRFDMREISFAYWLLLPPTLILPTITFARHRRRRRREAGNLCPTCGYDLRAHATGDRCPECGTSIQST